MQANSEPIVKDLVLVGGGHSHVEVLKRFGMRPLPGVRLTLVTRDLHTPYSGMLPGLVAGIYEFDDAHVDLQPLSRFAGARLIHAEVTELDCTQQQIICADRPPIDYDVLSINIGSRQATHSVPGAREFATAVKPINRFMAAWSDILDRAAAYPGPRRIGVVGAGAAGVEIILSMQTRLQKLLSEQARSVDEISFHLINKASRVLPNFHPGVSKRFERILLDRGIEILSGVEAVQAGSDRVVLSDGRELELDEILWVTEGGSQAWLAAAGLAVNEDGFVEVHDNLQSTSHQNIFAAGDIAHVVSHPRPKAGVIAVRQGPPLAENLRSSLLNKPLKPFKPQANMLALISTGDRYAIATRGNWHTEGSWVWRWKDWIDRRWMRKYHELPEMAPPPPASPVLEDVELYDQGMRCMGCGAKVAPDILSKVLRDLAPVKREDVVAGIHSPDDAALVRSKPGGLNVHTVDQLSALVDDPYIFGKIAAVHALSDIFAMGATPQTALATVTVPYSTPKKIESTIRELMSGALEALNEAATSLIGGHTAEGPELSLGFAINGHINEEKVLSKRGMQAGDVVILTKPLGVGVLFAADMRTKAKGRWISCAIESMLQSNREAAQIFSEYNAHACSDVTGFGLLGHLVEMSDSNKQIEILLDAIPCLPGAVALNQQGIYSSMFRANQSHFESHVALTAEADHTTYPLLFDPQTSGGLIAAISPESAENCIEALREAGYQQAAVIAKVASGEANSLRFSLSNSAT